MSLLPRAIHQVSPLTSADYQLLKTLREKYQAQSLNQDETKLYELLLKIHDHVFRDELTGLFNRKMFTRHATRQLRSLTHQTILYVIDINDFRDFNTQYGHLGGDAVLKQVAQKIGGCLRDNDYAYRLAGDEFCVLAQHVSSRGAKQLANRLWRTVKENSVRVAGKSVSVTVSIGYTVLTGGLKRSFKLADQALYRAKERKSGSRPTVYWGVE